ncbi:ATP-binding protein [Bacillus alkalicellulosilyticus]|uniref:ATP-binding protein n=1 Tax=Alkalihalobacterium alkalicellulosilyticum TaxID=1912214 RepID=UPI00099608F0|nr:ATP-binding protein [Bacillus alkalicellulosilyticus]
MDSYIEKIIYKEKISCEDWGEIERLQQHVRCHLKAVLDEFIFVEMAVNEALNNAIASSKNLEIEVTKDQVFLQITITDDGPGFDVQGKLQELNEKRDSLMDEILWSESGRGIYIMHKFMDEIKYSDKGNQVTLLKKLGGNGSADEHRGNW